MSTADSASRRVRSRPGSSGFRLDGPRSVRSRRPQPQQCAGQLGRQPLDSAGDGGRECARHRRNGLLEGAREVLLDERGNAPLGQAQPGGGQPVGRGVGDPVGQFVRLVHDHGVVFGQDRGGSEQVECQQRVVGHDDVRVAGGGPSALGKALRAIRAAGGSDAVAGRNRGLRPGAGQGSGVEFVPVAGCGRSRPGPQAQDVGGEAARAGRRCGNPKPLPVGWVGRPAFGVGVQGGLGSALVGRALASRPSPAALVGKAQPAGVVGAALQQGDDGPAAQVRRRGVNHPRNVHVAELGLQSQGGRGDDYASAGSQRRHQVGDALAGARARLHEQVPAAAERSGDGLSHAMLTGTSLAARQCADDDVQQVSHVGFRPGHQGRLAASTRPPVSSTALPYSAVKSWQSSVLPARDRRHGSGTVDSEQGFARFVGNPRLSITASRGTRRRAHVWRSNN